MKTKTVAAFAAALLFSCLPGLQTPARAEAGPTLPSSAPLFATSLTALDGRPMSFESLRGKPLIVNFWARWCGPCREELPHLIQADMQNRRQGLHVVGIAVEDGADAVREFAKAYEMTYQIVLGKDKSIELMQALGNPKAGLPYTIAIDRNGMLIGKKLGAIKKPELDAFVKTLLSN